MEAIGLQAILEDKAFQDGLHRYEQGISQMGTLTDQGATAMSKVWAVGSGVVIAGAAGVAVGMAGILAATKQGLDAITQWGNDLDDLGDKLGTTGEQSSTWALAMKQVGLDVAEGGGALNIFIRNLDDLKNTGGGAAMTTAKNADAIQSLQERLDDANVRLDRAKQKLAAAEKPTQEMQWAVDDAQKAVSRLNAELGAATKMVPAAEAKVTPFQAALKTLGVRAFDAHGKLRTFDDLMPEIMRGFAQMPDGVKKSALAMDLFGRSGTKFIDFLNQGPAGLQKATELAKLYGLTLSTDMVQATQDFQNAMEISKMGMQGFWVQIGAKVLPVANRFVNFFNYKLLPPLIKFAQWVAPKLGEGLAHVELIFEDFFALLSGENKLPQLAKNIGDLAGMFGLSETAVTDFVLKALTGLGQFKDWVVGFLPFLQKGDWGEVWNRLANGVSGAWKTIQPILAEWATKIWGWLADAAAQVPARVGEFVGAVGDWLSKNGPGAWAQLQAWGGQMWNWLVEKGGALDKAAGALSGFVGKIISLVGEYGPKAWDLVTTWGGQLWNWLVEKGGALDKAGGAFSSFIESLKKTVETYGPKAWNLATTWGGQIWDWLTLDGGALDQLGPAMTKFSTDLKTWASGDGKTAFAGAGEGIATAIIDAISSFFDSDPGKDLSRNSLIRFVTAMTKAVADIQDALAEMASAFTQGIADAIYKKFTGQEMTDKMKNNFIDWMKASIKAFTFNDYSDIFKSFAPPANLLPTLGGASPAAFYPANGGGAAQQIAALRGGGNMSLQVLIDGQEIKNAVLKVVYDDVTNLFNTATQQAVMTN